MDLGLNIVENEFEFEFEFWPIQHPVEPPDEDRPVKCPISDTSLVNDGRRPKEQVSDSWHKRAEPSAGVHKEDMVIVAAATEPVVGAVRKRHHTLTQEDQTISPLFRMPPIHPYSVPQSITIFDMMQHFNKFESLD